MAQGPIDPVDGDVGAERNCLARKHRLVSQAIFINQETEHPRRKRGIFQNRHTWTHDTVKEPTFKWQISKQEEEYEAIAFAGDQREGGGVNRIVAERVLKLEGISELRATASSREWMEDTGGGNLGKPGRRAAGDVLPRCSSRWRRRGAPS
jgi:hypothetical protein